MIENGADVNHVNRQGETCLFKGNYWLNIFTFLNIIKLLLALDNTDKVKVLLNAGANINVSNADGQTPLHLGNLLNYY